MLKVSIILPYVRPKGMLRCLEAIKAHAGIPEDGYEVLADMDADHIGCPAMVAKLVDRTKADLVMFLADDTIPQPGFLAVALQAMKALPDGWGVVCLNDGVHHGNFATHWLAHKRMLDHTGGEFFHTGYRHCFCDKELTDIARELGRYVYAPEAKITHDHPQVTGAAMDDDYARVYKTENFEHDQNLYWLRKQQRGGFKLGVAFPLVDNDVPASFAISALQMLAMREYSLFLPKFHGGRFADNLATCRNALVRDALEDGCTHLLMCDTDQVYQPDTLIRLLAHDVDVVGAAVHRRWPPFDLIMYRGELGAYYHVPEEERYTGKLIEVDGTGTGCILYKTEVFTKIKQPWFKCTKHEGKPVGEDIWCCHQLRTAGVKIHVDTGAEVAHLTTLQVNRAVREIVQKIQSAHAGGAS
jgi:GT2 family glycosyltransferase